MMPRPKHRPTYAELRDQNAQLQRQVTELEDLVRGLTQQLAEFLRSAGQRKSLLSPERGIEGRSEAFA